MNQHIIIRTTALADRPDAAVIAISAARFDPDTGIIESTLDKHITLQSAIDAGGAISASGLQRWADRENVSPAPFTKLVLINALFDLATWLECTPLWNGSSASLGENAVVWSSGRYDLAQVEMARRKTKHMTHPLWSGQSERHVKTLLNEPSEYYIPSQEVIAMQIEKIVPILKKLNA